MFDRERLVEEKRGGFGGSVDAPSWCWNERGYAVEEKDGG